MSVPTGRKVKIYVTGDIDVSLQHDGTPTNVQIFGQNSTSGSICMNGNDATNIHAFILAPNYDAGKTGNGQLRGSVFVKSWGKSSCMSSNPTVAMVQTQTWADIPPSLQPTSIALPIVAAFSGWQQIDTSLAANAIPAPPAYTGSYVSTNPTTTPTIAPTINPTIAPTTTPTIVPTTTPTIVPTATPTIVPTTTPTIVPTTTPTIVPTTTPTIRPTTTPTPKPSDFTTKKDCQDAGFTWNNPVGQDKPVCQ